MPLALGTRTARSGEDAGTFTATRGRAVHSALSSEVATPGRRRPRLVLLGAAILVTCTLAGAELARSESRRIAYLEVVRALPSGAVLRAGDLTSVLLQVSPALAAVPASGASGVLGRLVSGPIVAGSLLVREDLAHGTVPAGDGALVGTELSAGQFPAGLAAGDTVVVVDDPASGSNGSPAPVDPVVTSGVTSATSNPASILARATVFDVTATSPAGTPTGVATGSTVEVTLELPQTAAAAVAGLGASGQLSIVEVPPRAPVAGP